MIQVQINEEELKALYLQRLDERLKEIEQDVFFMNSAQLQKYLNMSWSTIEKLFLHDPEFGATRLGSRWLFHKETVKSYMEKRYEAVRSSSGDFLKHHLKI